MEKEAKANRRKIMPNVFNLDVREGIKEEKRGSVSNLG